MTRSKSRVTQFPNCASLHQAMAEYCTTIDQVPIASGAYVLAIDLSEPLLVDLPGKPTATLARGRYLYCGSAKGPGGLRARLARHLRRGKTIRWHIDHLTEAGSVLGVWTFRGGDECELAAALSHLPIPIAGFGSSDCRRCRSHLVRWIDGRDLPFDKEACTVPASRHRHRRSRSAPL